MKKVYISIFFFVHLMCGFAQNVGIGVSDPSCKLEVRSLQSPYPARFTSIAEHSAIRFGHDTEDYVEMGHLQNDAYIRMLTGGNFLVTRPGLTLLKLENLTGRLGMGTLTPNAMLHIEAYDEPTLALFKNETPHTRLRVENLITSAELGVDSLIGYVGVQQDRDFSLRTNAISRLCIKNNTGFIGLGTNAPVAPLHVTNAASQALLASFSNEGEHAKIEATTLTGTSILGFENIKGYVGTPYNMDFTIRTNGADRIFVDGQDGYLGIGVPDPLSLLHVKSPSTHVNLARFESTGGFGQILVSNGLITTDVGADSTKGYIGTNSDHNLSLRAGGEDVMFLQEGTKNVGIGTTQPECKFNVVSDEPYADVALFRNSSGHGSVLVSNGTQTLGLKATPTLCTAGTVTSTDFALTTFGDIRMYFQHSTGNVGIGTIAPGAPLHVNGAPAQALLTKFINLGDHAKIEVSALAGTTAMGFESSQGYVGTTNNRDFNIKTNGVNRLFIRGSDGFIGIGTNTPAKPLTIKADANQDLIQFQSNSGSNLWHWWMPNGELDLTRSGIQNGILRIDDIGFVGINTVNPQARLHVGGDLRVDQPTHLNDDLTVIGPVLINNSAVISGPVTLMNDVTISQNTTIGGTLTVTSIAQSAATNVSFENGFSNHGGNFGSTSYYKDKENRVHLKGMINVPAGGSGPMFTLPVGFRPPTQEAFTVLDAGGSTARIDINNSGQVILEPGYAGPISVSGVSFRTLQ